MTQKLYYENQYIKDFTANVVSCEKSEKGYEVILDKTAFYPEGGGQPGDTGFIGGAEVTDTVEKGEEVVHICVSEVGGEVGCSIDADRRFAFMQQHTGEHIFMGFIHKMSGAENVGFHMGESGVTVDLSEFVTAEQLDEAEKLANEAIYKNLPVKAVYPSSDELENYDYRSKKEIQGQVRLIDIEGVDLCACCGTHVAFTGEVGIIKIVSSMKYKKGVRLTLQIGRRAFEDYAAKHKNVHSISVALKAKPEEVSEAVDRIAAQLYEERSRYSALKKEMLALKTADYSGRECCVFDDGGSADDARILSDMLAEKVEIAAVFSGDDENGYKYAVTSRNEDVREIGKKMNAVLGARGGGKPEMIQGSVAAKKAEIEAFWKENI